MLTMTEEFVEKLGELIQAEQTRQDNCDLPLDNRLELIEKARDMYIHTDDVEIDDNAAFSPGEGGCWVGAWVWVPDEEEN